MARRMTTTKRSRQKLRPMSQRRNHSFSQTRCGLAAINLYFVSHIDSFRTTFVTLHASFRQRRVSRSITLLRRSSSTANRSKLARTHRHRANSRKRRPTQSCGLCTFVRTHAKRRIRTMFSIIRPATTQVHAATAVHALRAPIIVRSSVIVRQSAPTGSRAVAARRNATRNSAPAIWRCVNVIRIFAHAEVISTTCRRCHART